MATNGRVPEWHSTWNTAGTERVIHGYTVAVAEQLVQRGAAQLRQPAGTARLVAPSGIYAPRA